MKKDKITYRDIYNELLWVYSNYVETSEQEGTDHRVIEIIAGILDRLIRFTRSDDKIYGE